MNLITLIFSLLCFFTEPGIIQRNLNEKEIKNLENNFTNDNKDFFQSINKEDYSELETDLNLNKKLNSKENNLNKFMPSVLR